MDYFGSKLSILEILKSNDLPVTNSLFSLPALEMLMSLGAGEKQLSSAWGLNRNLAEVLVKSSCRVKGNTIPNLLQLYPNFWKVHPCSEACLKTGTAPCKKEYVKVMLMDDCCPELTLRCFVELGPVVGMGRQGNCNDISQKRWLQLLPPLLN